MGERALAQGRKDARARGAWIVFQDESGFSVLPVVRSTWAPRGKTPVIRHHLNHWKRMSMSAAVCIAPDRSDSALVFSMRPGSYNDEAIMEFLAELHEHLGGDKVTLIWDGLPSNKSTKMRRFLASQRRWLVVEPLPPYAYDLNPVEQVWGNLKRTELANLCPDTIDEVADIADDGLCRIGSDPTLCFAFVCHAGLRL